MSKNTKRPPSKEGMLINLKDFDEKLAKFRYSNIENLQFEVLFFLMSITILISTNIYIHKKVSNMIFN